MITKEILKQEFPQASISAARFKDHDFFLIKEKNHSFHIHVFKDGRSTIANFYDSKIQDVVERGHDDLLLSIRVKNEENNKKYYE